MDKRPKLNDVPPRLRDLARDAWLTEQGFLVLRFSDDLVLGNPDAVMDAVAAAIEERGFPSPASLREAPSPAEGGGRFASHSR